jgi:hypothetical protein
MTAVVRSAVRYENDTELLAAVLRVYKSHCRYLTSAILTDDDGVLGARCEFVIPESCYIDDTGHFNSVEFNICYNQMIYYVVAKAIKERLLPVFHTWTMDDYWARQLPDFFIARFESVFRTPMRGRHFHGEIKLRKVKEHRDIPGRQPLIWLDTTCGYWEDGGGRCDGQVRIAVRTPDDGAEG